MSDLTAKPAAPKYDLDDEVRYRDYHDRLQVGVVQSIEASWRWRKGNDPLIIYDLSHPTYHNRRCCRTDEDILS